MRRTILLYGLIGGVLITALKLTEYRFLVVEHSLELYGGLVDAARARGATPAEIESKTKELKEFGEMYDNPIYNAGMTFMEPLPVGLVIALISAGVLSRRRRRVAGEAIAGA